MVDFLADLVVPFGVGEEQQMNNMNTTRQQKLIGPPPGAALPYVKKRMEESCIECDCCGGMWHFKAEKRHGFVIQINISGRVMAVRKAAWIAFFPKRQVIDGMRITSTCSNPNCINPKLLVQVKPGALLAKHYKDGIRSKAEAAAHLIRYVRDKVKVDELAVSTIRNDDRKGTEAAHEWGITPEHYNAIQRGSSRASKVSNPFAGLGAR